MNGRMHIIIQPALLLHMLHIPVKKKNFFIGVIKINYLSILSIASSISLATSEEMFHFSGWNELSTDSETGDGSARISKF